MNRPGPCACRALSRGAHNVYDTAARLTGTSLRNSAGTILNRHTYLYNGGGQRQRQTLTDASYSTYGYDDDAQLTSSLGYTSGGSPVAAEQLGFGYDGGWNMTSRSVNGAPTAYRVIQRSHQDIPLFHEQKEPHNSAP